MRILVVTGSRLVGLLLSQQLHQHDLSIEIVDMATATAARDEPLILLLRAAGILMLRCNYVTSQSTRGPSFWSAAPRPVPNAM